MIAARLRETRWRIAVLVAVLIVAAGVIVLIVQPWNGRVGQSVDIVAGGGSSTGQSGDARSLRLPPITAMAAGKDGTVWAAAATDNAPQLIRIAPDGRASRTTVHTSDENAIASLGVAADGVLWALSGGGADRAYRLVSGRLVPAFAPFSAKHLFPPDGTVIDQHSPQPPMTQLAFDPAGRLMFLGTGSTTHCVTLRRIDRDGRITTLAGHDYSDRDQPVRNDAPANGTDARNICLAFEDTFAPMGDEAALIRTTAATFVVDLLTGRTRSLTSVSENSPTTPPIDNAPLAGSAPVGSLYMPLANAPDTQLCATSTHTWFAVNLRTSKQDDNGHDAPVRFPTAYNWRTDQGKLIDTEAGTGHSEVLLRVEGTRARIASAIASTVACTTHSVYVSAATADGKEGTIVKLPVH